MPTAHLAVMPPEQGTAMETKNRQKGKSGLKRGVLASLLLDML